VRRADLFESLTARPSRKVLDLVLHPLSDPLGPERHESLPDSFVNDTFPELVPGDGLFRVSVRSVRGEDDRLELCDRLFGKRDVDGDEELLFGLEDVEEDGCRGEFGDALALEIFEVLQSEKA
jgi:hypothetical protein